MGNELKKVNISDIIRKVPGPYNKGSIRTIYDHKLYATLCIPSNTHSYSLCVEFAKTWFLEKFNEKDYFKSIHLEGKHVLDDWRKFNSGDILKRLKPSLAIIPNIDFEFENKVDSTIYGIDQFVKRTKLDQSFFKDIENNLYIGLVTDLMVMNFNYRVRVTTKSQQIDLYNFMKLAFRVGYTRSTDIDMEFHIPYLLMRQLAEDAKFEVVDGIIKDPDAFTSYLNKNSVIPVVYKFRNITGKCEFFLKIQQITVHVAIPSAMNADDGEKEGQIFTNFIIDMQVTIRFPKPEFYVYHSYAEHDVITFSNGDGALGGYSLQLGYVPDKNEDGWDQFVIANCMEEDVSKPLKLKITDLFKDDNLQVIIDYTKKLEISPRIFLDIKLWNNYKEQDCVIDWKEMTIETKECLNDHYSHIIIYADKKFINDQIINMEDYYNNRIKK